MLRRKEDMKDWQKEALQEEKIVGKPAPKALPFDDAPEIPEDFIPEVKPAEEGKKPVKKVTTKKPAKKVEKIPVEE